MLGEGAGAGVGAGSCAGGGGEGLTGFGFGFFAADELGPGSGAADEPMTVPVTVGDVACAVGAVSVAVTVGVGCVVGTGGAIGTGVGCAAGALLSTAKRVCKASRFQIATPRPVPRSAPTSGSTTY